MRIGELAKLSGLAASRIRFYESSGLITSVDRKSNGYRDYGPDAVLILEIITGAQAAGFSLEEIRNLLPIGQNSWQHGELLDSLKRKVAEIEAMQARLEQNKAQLLVTIEVIESKPEGMQCGENTQRVLNRLRKEAKTATGSSRPAREG
ncbi:transcriptional regulator [Metapseudomonas resinovorans]|uniref:MerR family transcriptional regulator n=1 Tax=Metapseudomonas resinovorans TaxID=53412 RepID=UPI0009864FA7|nr:MerR family transcriptional regulator [Pseudomonas resinovorans]GLZ86324.1 transcriptional regulator [Pseudomonas resinovorans]